MPIYVLLPQNRQAQLVPLLSAGFCAASFSFLLFSLLFVHASFEQVGDTVYVRDGWRTLAGWRILFQETAFMGFAGAVGGLGFWAVRRLTIVGGDRESQ